MLAPFRFLWIAGRGHRLRPWRSPYLRWRIETYSGFEADRVRLCDFAAFAWHERRSLLRFLHWTNEMKAFQRHGLHPVQSAQAGPSEDGGVAA